MINREIQSLRTIAILSIVYLHSGVIFSHGDLHKVYCHITSIFDLQVGVELLFAISGYFFAIFLAKQKNIVIFDVFRKKFIRLFPNIFIWSLIPLVMSIITNDGTWLSKEIMYEKFLSTIFFIRNFFEIKYLSAFGYLWAISLEMQFFILMAIIVSLIRSYIFIYIILSIYIILCFFIRLPNETTMFMFRIDSMFAGVLVYHLSSKSAPPHTHIYTAINQY